VDPSLTPAFSRDHDLSNELGTVGSVGGEDGSTIA